MPIAIRICGKPVTIFAEGALAKNCKNAARVTAMYSRHNIETKKLRKNIREKVIVLCKDYFFFAAAFFAGFFASGFFAAAFFAAAIENPPPTGKGYIVFYFDD